MGTAPVNEAIEYQIKHFDLKPIPDGPFVGKGPQVDAMWEWATDGGKTYLSRHMAVYSYS